MSSGAAETLGLILSTLAVLRGFRRLGLEGWRKPGWILALILAVEAARRWYGASPWLLVATALLGLAVLARPSPHARLTCRVLDLAATLTRGMGLDIKAGVIPLATLQADFLDQGLEAGQARHFINAYAGKAGDRAVILVTPGAAALAEPELAFILAHEVGHHALGHTGAGLFEKIGQVLDSWTGRALSGGLGLLWKHLAVPRRSQAQEFAADAWALERLRALRLDTRGALAVMARFARAEQNGVLDRVVTKVFGSHPPATERMARLEARLGA